jgi:hypothetical protein
LKWKSYPTKGTPEQDIPVGQLKILVGEKTVYLENQQIISGIINIPPSSGIVLLRN